MIRNQAGQTVSFQAVNITTGAPVTTGTPVVYVTIGGVQASSTNTASHAGNGEWELDLTAAETNSASVAFTFTLTNAINQTVNVYPVTLSDYQADVSGLSTFNPTTDTVANVTTVGTCTTNTDMRGTDSAFLAASAPSNFSALGINISGHVSRVTLVDTTTANSDMRGTDGANTTTPPTVSEIVNGVWDEPSSSHATAGTFGLYVDSQLSFIRTVVDSNANEITNVQSTLAGSPGVFLAPAQESAIVDAVWDEATASHATAGTFGATAIGTGQGVVNIEVVTDRLGDMLVLNGEGSVYQYTVDALENAPTGGGGGGASGSSRIAF